MNKMRINYEELVDYNDVEINEDTNKADEIIEYEEILFEISKSIFEYRKEKKLTQKQLAKILDVDQVMISKLESGNYNPTFKQLHKISRQLTGTASLFIDTIRNIINNLTNVCEVVSKKNIESANYKNEKSNVYYMSIYNNYNGGIYESEECTSSISNAG